MSRLGIVVIIWTVLYLVIGLSYLCYSWNEEKNHIVVVQMVWVSGMYILCCLNLYNKRACEWLQEKVKR